MILTVASFPTFAEDAALDLTNNATITMGFEKLIDGDTTVAWTKSDSNRADVTFEVTLHGTADIGKEGSCRRRRLRGLRFVGRNFAAEQFVTVSLPPGGRGGTRKRDGRSLRD
ncbi:MAG TPA: hypothetical protein DCE08_05915 [Ruminococcaceae bacterium]|nr:hypothetical protein [Oscillospiraceae bacterium]